MADELTTVPLSGPVALHLRVGHGSLLIAALEGLAEATVQLTPRAGGRNLLERMTVELQEDRLVVTGPRQGGLPDLLRGWGRDRDAVDVAVEVPVGTPVTVASASGDITITGRCGSADLAFAAGRLDLGEVAGDLRVRCGTGDVYAAAVRGSAKLGAGNSTVRLGDVGGALHVKLGRGDVAVGEVRGAVHVRNGHGALRLDAVHETVDVMTGSGTIDIGLPTGIAAKVDASSGQGVVHSAMPVESARTAAGHSITVRARTRRGDISLHRPQPAAA